MQTLAHKTILQQRQKRHAWNSPRKSVGEWCTLCTISPSVVFSSWVAHHQETTDPRLRWIGLFAPSVEGFLENDFVPVVGVGFLFLAFSLL